ncbi:MAG TPA: 1-acyl-sn-glycerol-3-phosphate acyltransferase [Erysipelotrichaceae bacterium]|nr:1-acyl-sn-glycerol-3-phosphate acyltransferase [Erysipelotrichaceae bacterium]
MIRLVFIVIRFFFEIPSIFHRIHKQLKNKDQISVAERIDTMRRILRKAVKRANVDLKVYGVENLPEEGGFLITPNHQGMFDIVALFYAIDRPFKIVYKKELRKIKIVADALDSMDYLAIDRQNLRQSIQVIRQVKKELAEGMPWVIFPEGTRSKNGNQLLEFKGGSFKSAMDAKVPVVPVANINCYEVLDRNTLKKVHCQIHFLKPISYEEYKDMNSEELAMHVKKLIERCIEEHA